MADAAKQRKQLTPLELKIMKVLWTRGPSTVQAVVDGLAATPKLAYTTVQTMLNVLHRKGRVNRTQQGRAYEYAPILSRERAASIATRDMIDRLFGGSVEDLLMSLIKSRQLDSEKLRKLNIMVEERARGTKGERNGTH
jgi:predicted transcriptional regulator